MKFHFIVVGRNGPQWVRPCLESIAAQRTHSFDVHVIDDASDDPEQPRLVKEICESYGWDYTLNTKRMGAMYNQFQAWNSFSPRGDDVMVWVDLDDRLAHRNVLNVLSAAYRQGMYVTYGSYTPDPPSATCPPVREYPMAIMRAGTLREHIRHGGGLRFNHLRTVSWRVLQHITADDCKDSDGEWFQTAADAAVMIPALELAGWRYRRLEDVLYIYTSDNPLSDWRISPGQLNKDHAEILKKEPKARIR